MESFLSRTTADGLMTELFSSAAVWQIIVQILVLGVLVISARSVYHQVREMNKSAEVQALQTAFEMLQQEKIRAARRAVFGLQGKPLKHWSYHEIEQAEMFCHTYDCIGMMVHKGLLPKDIFLDNWGDSLTRGYPVVKRLIEQYRRERNAPETWDDIDWLNEQAQKRLPKVRARARRRLGWKGARRSSSNSV